MVARALLVAAVSVLWMSAAPALAQQPPDWRSSPPDWQAIGYDRAGNRLYWDTNGNVVGRYHYASGEFQAGPFKVARWYDLTVNNGSAHRYGYPLAKVQRGNSSVAARTSGSHRYTARVVRGGSSWATSLDSGQYRRR